LEIRGIKINYVFDLYSSDNPHGIVLRDFKSVLREQLAIPYVARSIIYYPNYEQMELRDFTDGEKFRNSSQSVPDSALMKSNEACFVDDFVLSNLRSEGKCFITRITAFYIDNGHINYTGDDYIPDYTNVLAPVQVPNPTLRLVSNIHCVLKNSDYTFTDGSSIITSTYRVNSNGLLHTKLPLSVFIDDFGRSKKGSWNPIHGCYVNIVNIPRELRNTDLCRTFIGCTTRTTSTDTFLQHLFEMEMDCYAGFIAYNSHLRQLVFVTSSIFVAPCDNAMGSYYGNHGGIC
jgi:hypothetical protein